MYLSRHRADGGARWALDGRYLPPEFTLERLLELPAADVRDSLEGLSVEGEAEGPLLAPVEPAQDRLLEHLGVVLERDLARQPLDLSGHRLAGQLERRRNHPDERRDEDDRAADQQNVDEELPGDALRLAAAPR